MFVVTFDWETPTDTRSMRLNCILQDRFRDTLLDNIRWAQKRPWIWPNTEFSGVYLVVPNTIKWDIPEKILQNAVQMR